jgi:uncharacterized lipoprotein YddW (UPF0748 family)
MKRNCFAFALYLSVALCSSLHAASYESSSITPPQPRREFRAGWVATVGNIDWPSRKDLRTAEQKSELLNILDRAAKLKMNAIIFQVRPACDALYQSKLEPWSEYLTGTMGKAPEPFYDPLAFAIEEAHKRGLELHAWFNPYRAVHSNAKSAIAATHISKTRPELVRRYGSYLWLDPGERAVQDYSLSVVLDVMKRYDVDGVHFDDYFYPYKEYGNGADFPDEASWKKFGAGGKLERNDWRRENVNVFIERLSKAVHAEKPWVKFGISPFGIWRPGHPPTIKGFDAHDALYADSRKWLVNGWVDYFAPQIYWSIAAKEQSFPVLLDWWNEQNPKKRHIWPGIDTTKIRNQTAGTESFTTPTTYRTNSRPRVSWQPEEILSQINLAAKQRASAGHIHWNMRSLLRSSELQAQLASGPYAEAALVPASPWLASRAPGKPQLNATLSNSSVKLTWEISSAEPVRQWVLQTKQDGKWTTRILPNETRSQILDSPAEVIALAAVDRVGNLGSWGSLALKK